MFRQPDEQQAEREAAKMAKFRQREAAREERQAAADARKAHRAGLEEYVREHKRERLATFQDVHLFPDGIIRLPGLASSSSLTNWTAAPEKFPVTGVRATVDSSGGVGGRAPSRGPWCRGHTGGRRRSTPAKCG